MARTPFPFRALVELPYQGTGGTTYGISTLRFLFQWQPEDFYSPAPAGLGFPLGYGLAQVRVLAFLTATFPGSPVTQLRCNRCWCSSTFRAKTRSPFCLETESNVFNQELSRFPFHHARNASTCVGQCELDDLRIELTTV